MYFAHIIRKIWAQTVQEKNIETHILHNYLVKDTSTRYKSAVCLLFQQLSTYLIDLQ